MTVRAAGCKTGVGVWLEAAGTRACQGCGHTHIHTCVHTETDTCVLVWHNGLLPSRPWHKEEGTHRHTQTHTLKEA